MISKFILFLAVFYISLAQTRANPDSVIVTEIEQRSTIQQFFQAISKHYKFNVSVDSDVQVTDKFQFYNISIANIVTYVAQKYNLDVIESDHIIRLKKKVEEKPVVVIPPKKEPTLELDSGKLTIDVENITVSDFTKLLSEKLKISMISDPKLSATISGQLHSVEFESGLQELLKINNLRMLKSNSIYRIERLYTFENSSDKSNEAKRSGFFVDITDSLIILDAPKASLSQIVHELLRQADVDVVFYNEVSGDVSARIKETNLDNILIRLFRNTKFTFKKNEAGVYFIGDKTLKDLISQEVIPLKYLRAGEGSTSSYARPSGLSNNSFTDLNQSNNRSTNNSIINRNASNQRNSANVSNLSNAGHTSQALFTELSRSNITAVPLVEQNAILVSGTTQDIEDAREIVSMLDKPIPQIFIEALIIDIKDNISLDKDIKAYRAGSAADSIKSSTSYIPFEMLFNASDLNPITSKIGEALGSKRIGVLPSDFFLFLRMQESKDNIKINSRPQITTTNGEEAFITIGETRYFKINDGRIIDSNSGNQNSNVNISLRERFEQLDIVNTLRVKPWANYNGDVTVRVTPEFQSAIGGTEDLPPTVSFQQLDSTVRLKNGQTLILGGLVREENSDIKRDYFPLLSWLPWIGDWFISTSKGEGKSELLIYITPHVYYGEDIKPNIPQSDFK
jgi:type IV pilus assembly protein PilQ